MNWNNYYMDQAGGEYNIYKGSVYQRGYGLGGSFRKFFNWIMPLVKKHALPTLESGVKVLGKEALSTVSGIANDLIKGKKFQESAENRISTAIDNVKDKAEQSLSGKGIKRRAKNKNYIILKKSRKKRSQDIFD